MGALERRGVITDPRALPRLRPEAKPQAPSAVEQPERPVFPKSRLVAERPQSQVSQQPRPQEAPKQQPVDAYGYVSKLVKGGSLTPEQGMEILGAPEAERQRVVAQLQAQERQAEATLRELGIYDQVKRMEEIQREIPTTIIPLEGAKRVYAFDDPNHKHPYREWRTKDGLKPMKFRQRLWHVVSSPKELVTEGTYPLADVFFVDNPDGTQTRYVDRVQQVANRVPEPDVYKETYSKPNRFGHRKLLSRERVGENIIQTGWDASAPGKEKKPVFGIATEQYYDLVEEQFRLQSEITAKQEQKLLDKINFAGTDYTPAKRYRKTRKLYEDTIDNLLWSQQDTPGAKASFAARSFLSNTAFYMLYQDFLPTMNLPTQALSVGGYGVGNQLMLFNWKDLGRYAMDHKYQTAFRLGMPIAFVLLPSVVKLPLGAALMFGQPLLMKAIPKITKERDFRKFKAQHPEIGSDMMRKEFDLEYPAIQRQKGLDTFAKHHQEWYDQLKSLNPTVDDNIIKSGMMIKARGYHSGSEELRQIVTQVAGEATNAGLMKYLVVPALISAPVNMLLAQTGLSPLVDHIISAAVQSAAATGGSMKYLDTTMGKTKQYIAQTHPELIPENRRRNGNSRIKSTQS